MDLLSKNRIIRDRTTTETPDRRARITHPAFNGFVFFGRMNSEGLITRKLLEVRHTLLKTLNLRIGLTGRTSHSSTTKIESPILQLIRIRRTYVPLTAYL